MVHGLKLGEFIGFYQVGSPVTFMCKPRGEGWEKFFELTTNTVLLVNDVDSSSVFPLFSAVIAMS